MVQEKKFNIDFHDGGHLGFSIRMILATVDLQVTSILGTFILEFEPRLMNFLKANSRRLLTPRLMNFLKTNYLVMALAGRHKRAVVNGETSEWAPVLSGVPQGTVLGPLLFSLYINNISTDIESEIRLFADDCACYREIRDTDDSLKLQKNIN